MHNNPLKERLVKGDHAFGTMAFELVNCSRKWRAWI